MRKSISNSTWLRHTWVTNSRFNDFARHPSLFSFRLAARMIYTAQTQFEDIESQTTIDLGIGTGMLSIASCLLGADHVFGFDCDPEALTLSQFNIEEFELQSSIDLIQADLRRVRLPIDSRRIRAETIMMNPPFGTKPFSTAPEEHEEFSSLGIDMQFLQHASRLATHSIYSLHKTTTREHIVKKAKEWQLKMDVLAVLQFDIPKLEKKRAHRKTSTAPLKSIEVDFIRFEIKEEWCVAVVFLPSFDCQDRKQAEFSLMLINLALKHRWYCQRMLGEHQRISRPILHGCLLAHITPASAQSCLFCTSICVNYREQETIPSIFPLFFFSFVTRHTDEKNPWKSKKRIYNPPT